MVDTRRDGTNDESVKNQNEVTLFSSFVPIKQLKETRVSVPGTLVTTDGDDLSALLAYGEDVCIVAEVPVEAAANTVFTVVGTDQDDAPLTGEGTMPPNVPKGAAVDIIPSVLSGRRYKTITSIAIGGGEGVAGDKYELMTIPLEATFTLIGFDTGFSIETGAITKPIPKKFDPADHHKRIRPENTFRASALYLHNQEGLSKIKGREVTIKAEVSPDGGGVISETIFLSKTQVSAPTTVPADGGDGTVAAEGVFSRDIIFS
jgi:hypothetical protein